MKFGKHKKDKDKTTSAGAPTESNNAKETKKTSSKKSREKGGDHESSSVDSSSSSSSSTTTKIQQQQQNDKVFGGPLPLDEEIPPIIVQTVEYLEAYALKTPGIFRESGSQQLITHYKQLYEAGKPVTFAPYEEHVVASILKAYLRELKDPLFSFENYDMFVACESISDETVKLEVVKKVIKLLPIPNIRVIKYLMNFLTKVVANSESNKMTAESLSIVFLPTVLRPLATDHKILQYTVEDSKSTKTLMATMLNNYDNIFEDPSVLMPRTRQTRAVTEFVTSTSTPFKFNQVTPPPLINVTSPPPLQISSPTKSSASSAPSTPANIGNGEGSANTPTPLVLSPKLEPNSNIQIVDNDIGRKELDIPKQQQNNSPLSTSPSSKLQPPPPLSSPTTATTTTTTMTTTTTHKGSNPPPPLPIKPTTFQFNTPVNNTSTSNPTTNTTPQPMIPPKPVPKIPKEKTGSSLSVNQQHTSTSTTTSPTFQNESPKMTRKILFEVETRPRSSTSV